MVGVGKASGRIPDPQELGKASGRIPDPQEPGLELQAGAISAYLARHERKPLLRFITCGSVDDGKSTLIGRLLYESKQLYDDQLARLERDSARHGTQGEAIDYALLLDGLAAEREQGITIDVAYRFFGTDRRQFIVADCPGHEQYTRNMATGASTADVAVVLVDARKGLLTQTRRHSYIVALLGIRDVVLAVNKMDLVGYDQSRFDAIATEYRELAATLGIARVQAIPLSGLVGDNVIARSTATPWYAGPPLLEHLEIQPLPDDDTATPLRMPVQWVCRPHADFRGYAGLIASGRVQLGDELVSLPSGRHARVASIAVGDAARESAQAGESALIALDHEIDVSRGDVLASAAAPCAIADQFAVQLLWLDDAPLMPGRRYLLKSAARTVTAQVTAIKHKVDVNTQEHLAATRLLLNEVAVCNLSLDQDIAFAPYAENRALGAFILIDRSSNATVAMGRIEFALRRASNVHWQALDVGKQARAAIKGQVPRCLWFTGLSGSGKSTIANLVEKRLLASGHHTYLLDGDNVRHGLNRDLGFSAEDRVENIRRVSEVARLMVDAGLIVIVSFISPFRDERRMARERFADGEFIEVFVDTPLEVCEQRDVKGLYAKARAGLIPNFTGIDSPYERPEQAELVLDTTAASSDQLAMRVVEAVLG
ncbi:MAG: sulfate adenylyltransferase subunit CysN [Xanthomonadales bacterium]|nr:sulfate adenylyltransferase subunit CysN [Xanthomonadales bacterium]MBK7144837.1 sulfate adenylyltransferase subunit CysN [Xanthomonadales bacterium]